MSEPLIFLPGDSTPIAAPLGRFLPPLHGGVVSAWLEKEVPKGSLILDPFGAAPQLAVEAARAGYRIVVAANNPIARFLTEMLARAPKPEELQSALADLASARSGEERLEPHILNLYSSRCPACDAQISARAFIWERGAENPQAKIIQCEHCGHKGEHPTDAEDLERAGSFQGGGPYRARALERIAARDTKDREHAEEAIDAYLPRAVYAIFTIINRLEGLAISEERRDLIFAMLLSTLDRGNTLWTHPSGRTRPKQLSTPSLFREHNIWRELESSIVLWDQNAESINIVSWPELPSKNGGISLFDGRLRDMVPDLEQLKIDGIMTAFPRPNQAYWTLSALWAGWLWGREAIGAFANVLRRRRYDWAWHSEALQASLGRLSSLLAEGTPIFGIIAEAESGFNNASITAANQAGFKLEGLAYRRELGHLQLHWSKGLKKRGEGLGDAAKKVGGAARDVLLARGEPSHFLHLQSASLQELAKRPIAKSSDKAAGDVYTETRDALEAGLTFGEGFLRYGSSENSLESGKWWLSETDEARSPLADRLEIAVVRYLIRHSGQSTEEIDRRICEVFPGLLTPARDLLMTVLSSYGEEDEQGFWKLSDADRPRARRDDLKTIRSLLINLGEQLGYRVEGENPFIWLDEDDKEIYSYQLIASGLLGEILFEGTKEARKKFIVLPGRRSGLVLAKIARDPRLEQAVEEGWRFLKFRHVRRLAENQSLTRESVDELLEIDPLSEGQSQAPLL